MKSKLMACFLLISLILAMAGCGKSVSTAGTRKQSASETTEAKVQSLTFVKLPSPPKCKTTQDMKVINEILDYLEKGKKDPIKVDKALKGWEIFIKLDKGSTYSAIAVVGTTLDIDNKYYNVSKDYVNGLLEIYDKMSAPEKDYAQKQTNEKR